MAEAPRLSDAYHATRFAPDPRRAVVWEALWRYHFSGLIAPDQCVLDIGCGYGNFINTVVARRRVALDAWPGFPAHVAAGVETHVGPATELGFLGDGTVDFAFASNLFEHLTQAELAALLAALRPKLAAGGSLNILQPNWRYAFREYWDDYTHVTAWSDTGLSDFLAAHGFEVFEIEPRFLPLTVKSRLPVSPLLIRLWLASPFRPGGKQMFLRARPKTRGA